MALGRTGEFGLIHRIRQSLPPCPSHVIKGIGDDAALIAPRPGFTQVITTDILVEHVHYDLRYTPLDSLGWKALAVNLSDLAAMAAEPRCAVVNLGLPSGRSDGEVTLLYDGLNRCSAVYACPIVGGDTVQSPRHSFIGITVIGEVEEGKAVLRSGARTGDWICLTGTVGGSRTGFDVLHRGADAKAYSESALKFLEPTPQIQAARSLLSTGGVTAMIDISDGLASEIHHICEESRVGCRIESELIPIPSETVKWCAEMRVSPTEFAMCGGEEYALLFTCAPSAWRAIQDLQIPVTRIGEIVPQLDGIKRIDAGMEQDLRNAGWDHFQTEQSP